jgi:glycosyltransferase involved in cell wall biosynthesis
MPELSIITVNLNNRGGLEKTIRSVIEQTFTDFEFIVIDGGSTDGSAELLNTYQGKITCGISEKDSGIYQAMNKGIKYATGEYCLFLNSGDTLFNSETLSRVFSRKRNEDILFGNLIFDYLDGRKILRKMNRFLTFKHMIRDTLWHPVSFIKRDLFDQIGLYNEQFRIAADYDFFLKAVIVRKVSLYYLDQTIAVYGFDGVSSLPANAQELKNERLEIQLQYFKQIEIDKAMKKSNMEKVTRKLKSWIG